MNSYFVNVVLGAFTIITIIFTCGDIDKILHSPYGLPIIDILYSATNSIPATVIMVLLLMMPLFASAIAVVATASRQFRGFSRDLGRPFSNRTGFVSRNGRAEKTQTLIVFKLDSPKGPYPHQCNMGHLGRLFCA
jgi:choline transport protein